MAGYSLSTSFVSQIHEEGPSDGEETSGAVDCAKLVLFQRSQHRLGAFVDHERRGG